jgi:hypothetical protein
MDNRTKGGLFAAVLVVLTWSVLASADDPWADTVMDYSPNGASSGYDDPNKALGPPIGTDPAIPNNNSIVALGGPGGAITLRFDTPVTDDPDNPLGLDCIVFSNAFWVGGNPQKRFQEPAVVEISRDVNGDGFANDPWYLIPGSRAFPYDPFPLVSEPDGDDNEPPLPPDLLAGNIRNPNLLDGDPANDQAQFHWGYAEMTPTAAEYLDNYVRPDDSTAVGMTARSGGGDAFDIAWAVDIDGNPANITQFDFIRLTAFVERMMGALGLATPEIDAVADVAPEVDEDGDGILDEYETRVAGTDPARPESTILPLEIPPLEGGSPPGTILGTAEDLDGNKFRLFAADARTVEDRNMSCKVDILAATDPGGDLPVSGLIKSAAVREFQSSEPDFEAAETQHAQFAIRYRPSDIAGLDEEALEPWRYVNGAYTQEGVSEVAVNAAANLVTFRSRYPGVFVLVSGEGSGDAGGAGPQGEIALTADPPGEVVADPTHVVTVTSGVILDDASNPIADGTLITVSASCGSMVSPDADVGIPGVQIASSSGSIVFEVAAATVAGSALFTATSVEGAAYGELEYFYAPGPPVGPIEWSADEVQEGGPPVTVDLTTDIVRDQYGNTVRDGTLLTVAVDGAVIVSGDADLGLSGHQIVLARGRGTITVEVPDVETPFWVQTYGGSGQSELLSEQELRASEYVAMRLEGTVFSVVLLLGFGVTRLRAKQAPCGRC